MSSAFRVGSGRSGKAWVGMIAWAFLSTHPLACSDASETKSAGASRDAPASAPPSEIDAGDARIRDGWSAAELALLQSMSIDALAPPPKDPSNRVADDLGAAALGQLVFFDERFSSSGRVSCARCHEPERFFTDGKTVSQGVALTDRNAPTVVGTAYSPWLFWDGRRDSLWAQALAPFESAAEMNVTRSEVVRLVAEDPGLSVLYEKAFGDPPLPGDPARLPPRAGPFGDPPARDAWARMAPADREAIDHAFANVGKAIAAYQRQLDPGPGRFDRYVHSLQSESPSAEDSALTPGELQGLRLFMDAGRTQCLRCHNGPLFTNQGFHRIGTETTAQGFPEFGRFLGLQAALVDPFNCLGPHSDAKPEECRELRFLRRDHVDAEMGKFKTPTLRGLSKTAPYMHDGRFATLEEVIDHYREPPPNPPNGAIGHELVPLALSDEEGDALARFLETLDGGIRAEARWLAAPARVAGDPR